MKKLMTAFIAALVLVGTASAGPLSAQSDTPAGGVHMDGKMSMWAG
ncbi:hypothetical protein ACFP9V_06135 [Deinococcus radiopugnans]|uniref:Spy/CpxP family protein refolding chaperone n=1 Tax=Deinococcus radiopugnans ATCC 19172 TaxID=585398 RepID=A0ABR6NN90_9DEIO|nr:hypothetical protein [Deinococcus radiopugnans]MBB6015494.1 Spy/CpxP family protein refolding chaperone [Deinococcus radiopugnans ATCC 19172]QLG09668.1 hypothetical protein HLB42_01985 [Deinococcus sp. D7000]